MPDLTFKNVPQWVLDAYKQWIDKVRTEQAASRPDQPSPLPATNKDVMQQIRGNIVGPARGFINEQKQIAARTAALAAVKKEMDEFTDQEE